MVAKEKKEVSEYLDASYILDRPKKIVPTTPALDLQLSGGIPESTIVLITSEPKVGKTTLALQTIANGQSLYDKIGVFVDVEERLKEMNLHGVKGLDLSPEKFKIIKSQEGQILSAEQYLAKAEKALIDFPGCIMCFDSFSALCPSNEQTNDYGDQTMGGSAKLQSKFARRVMPIISVNNNIIFGVMHTAPNIGSSYGGMVENVAKKMQYAHDVKIKGTKANPFEWFSDEGKGSQWIGQRVEWEVITSALGARGGKCLTWMKYGYGYAAEMDIIQMAVDLGLIEKGGAWYTMQDGSKYQGVDNLYNYLVENPNVYDKLNEQVRGMLYES